MKHQECGARAHKRPDKTNEIHKTDNFWNITDRSKKEIEKIAMIFMTSKLRSQLNSLMDVCNSTKLQNFWIKADSSILCWFCSFRSVNSSWRSSANAIKLQHVAIVNIKYDVETMSTNKIESVLIVKAPRYAIGSCHSNGNLERTIQN